MQACKPGSVSRPNPDSYRDQGVMLIIYLVLTLPLRSSSLPNHASKLIASRYSLSWVWPIWPFNS